MTEHQLLRSVLANFNRGAVRLFRNTCGMYATQAGHVIRYGVANPGGSDLLGWKTVRVTQDMVGRDVAVLLAVELKTDSGRVTTAQANFIDAVQRAGGIAGVVRSETELQELLR